MSSGLSQVRHSHVYDIIGTNDNRSGSNFRVAIAVLLVCGVELSILVWYLHHQYSVSGIHWIFFTTIAAVIIMSISSAVIWKLCSRSKPNITNHSNYFGQENGLYVPEDSGKEEDALERYNADINNEVCIITVV